MRNNPQSRSYSLIRNIYTRLKDEKFWTKSEAYFYHLTYMRVIKNMSSDFLLLQAVLKSIFTTTHPVMLGVDLLPASTTKLPLNIRK